MVAARTGIRASNCRVRMAHAAPVHDVRAPDRAVVAPAMSTELTLSHGDACRGARFSDRHRGRGRARYLKPD